MEIVTLIILVVVQVALEIGFVVVYNKYQKATKKVYYLEREIEKLTQPSIDFQKVTKDKRGVRAKCGIIDEEGNLVEEGIEKVIEVMERLQEENKK